MSNGSYLDRIAILFRQTLDGNPKLGDRIKTDPDFAPLVAGLEFPSVPGNQAGTPQDRPHGSQCSALLTAGLALGLPQTVPILKSHGLKSAHDRAVLDAYMKPLLLEAAERSARYLEGVHARRVAPEPNDVARLAALGGPLPQSPADPAKVLALLRRPDGATLLHIDRHFVHDGSGNAFRMLKQKGLAVRRPDRTFATPDH